MLKQFQRAARSQWSARIVIVLILLAIAVVVPRASETVAQDSGVPLNGWAWSSNVGWISFNSSNCNQDPLPAGCGTPSGINYSVKKFSDGFLEGFAWSSNIGWIQFDRNINGSGTGAKINGDGSVTGWAKALAANGNGWDGWIKMSGSWNDGVTVVNKTFSGFAWGSDVLGWIRFTPFSTTVVEGVDIKASINGGTFQDGPFEIPSGATVELQWGSSGDDSRTCEGTGDLTNPVGQSGDRNIGEVLWQYTKQNYLYGVRCTDSNGTFSDTVVINVVPNPTASLLGRGAGTSDAYTSAVTITSGEGVELQWSSTNAASCVADNNAFETASATSGTVTLNNITAGTVYGITCSKQIGSWTVQDHSSVTVNVTEVPPPTVDLKVAKAGEDAHDGPARIASGENVTLSWTSTGAASCSTNFGSTALQNTGLSRGPLTTSQLYWIRCQNTSGAIMYDDVTVNVLTLPTADLKVDGGDGVPNAVRIIRNSVATIAWSSQNTSQCVGDANPTSLAFNTGNATSGSVNSGPVGGPGVDTAEFILRCTQTISGFGTLEAMDAVPVDTYTKPTTPKCPGAPGCPIDIENNDITIAINAIPSNVTQSGTVQVTWNATEAEQNNNPLLCWPEGDLKPYQEDPGGHNWKIGTLTTDPLTQVGSYDFVLTCNKANITDSATTTVVVTAPDPDFTVSANPSNVSIRFVEGVATPANSTVAITNLTDGFNSPITLSIPPGEMVNFTGSASLSATNISPTGGVYPTVTLQVSASAANNIGTGASLKVRATGGGKTRDVLVNINRNVVDPEFTDR